MTTWSQCGTAPASSWNAEAVPASTWDGCGPAPTSAWRFCDGPGLDSIDPSAGAQGVAVPVTLLGSGFDDGSSVAVSGVGVTVSDVVVVNARTITAIFTVDLTATLGDRSVTVTTAAGSSNALPFTVEQQTPVILSITPSTGVQESTVPVEIVGQYFTPAATVQVSGTGVTVQNVVVVDDEHITAEFVLALLAAHTTRDVTVTT